MTKIVKIISSPYVVSYVLLVLLYFVGVSSQTLLGGLSLMYALILIVKVHKLEKTLEAISSKLPHIRKR